MIAQLSFFNTTNLSGTELKACVDAAQKQDNAVIDAFNLFAKLTPSDCWQYLIRTKKIDGNVPLTSVRRSITTLTKKEKLASLEEKKIGVYGRPEGFWQKA